VRVRPLYLWERNNGPGCGSLKVEILFIGLKVPTDKKSLKFLLDQTISITAQQRWWLKLLGYEYEIEYKWGKENSAIDALSRVEGPKTLMAISLPVPHWLESIQGEKRTNSDLQALVSRIQEGEAEGPWEFKESLIFFKERVVFV